MPLDFILFARKLDDDPMYQSVPVMSIAETSGVLIISLWMSSTRPASAAPTSRCSYEIERCGVARTFFYFGLVGSCH